MDMRDEYLRQDSDEIGRLNAELTQLREQQWTCPACGFTCERIHVEDQPDEEKCPACNEQRLREQVAAKDAEITRLEDVISLLKLSGAGWRSV